MFAQNWGLLLFEVLLLQKSPWIWPYSFYYHKNLEQCHDFHFIQVNNNEFCYKFDLYALNLQRQFFSKKKCRMLFTIIKTLNNVMIFTYNWIIKVSPQIWLVCTQHIKEKKLFSKKYAECCYYHKNLEKCHDFHL